MRNTFLGVTTATMITLLVLKGEYCYQGIIGKGSLAQKFPHGIYRDKIGCILQKCPLLQGFPGGWCLIGVILGWVLGKNSFCFKTGEIFLKDIPDIMLLCLYSMAAAASGWLFCFRSR